MVLEQILTEISKEVALTSVGLVGESDSVANNKLGAAIGGIGTFGAASALLGAGFVANPIGASVVLATVCIGAITGSQVEAKTKQIGGAIGQIGLGTIELLSVSGLALGYGSISLVGKTVTGVVNFFKTPEELLEDVERFIKADKYERAEQLLNNIIRDNPEDIDPRLARAALYSKFSSSQLQDLALKDFDFVLQQNPFLITALEGRVSILMRKQEYDSAIQDLIKIIHLEDGKVSYYLTRATAYLALGEYRQAIQDYTSVINLDSTVIKSYFLRGCLWLELGELQKAIADFSKYLAKAPDDIDAYRNRAIAYLQQKDYEKALRDYASVLNLDPQNVEALVFQFTCLKMLQRYAEAINTLNFVEAINPDKIEIYLDRADCFIKMGKYDKAIKDYNYVMSRTKKVEQEHSTYVRACYLRAGTWIKTKKTKAAIKDFNEVLKLDPDYIDAYIELSQIYVGQQKFKLAEKVLAKAHQRSLSFDAASKIGSALLSVKDSKSRIPWWNRKIF